MSLRDLMSKCCLSILGTFFWMTGVHTWSSALWSTDVKCIVGYIAVPIPHSHIWCILDKKSRAITFTETCQLVNLELEHCLSGVSQGWKCVLRLQIWHCATWFSALLRRVLFTKKKLFYIRDAKTSLEYSDARGESSFASGWARLTLIYESEQ